MPQGLRKRARKLAKRVTNTTGKIIAAPSTIRNARRARTAESGTKAVKLLRGMKRVPANPKTKLGRMKLRALGTKAKAVSSLKKRR